jgi:heme/copper-type cytochrome/quinol oxidase subunit 2
LSLGWQGVFQWLAIVALITSLVALAFLFTQWRHRSRTKVEPQPTT